MKTKTKAALALLALGASAWVIIAQDNGASADTQRPQRPQGTDNQGGGPGMRRRHPVPLIISALDTNHDGVIDANEIANAPAALKTLDKNGDGKLTMDELMGPPPRGMDGPPDQDQENDQGRPPRRNGGPNFDGPPGPPPGDQ